MLGMVYSKRLNYVALYIQVLTMGALHQIDSATLRKAAIMWRDEFEHVPRPLLVVNIGGPTGNFHDTSLTTGHI